MLGIRLDSETEEALDRHARAIGRSKSVIVRDWITTQLERESIDVLMAHAAAMHARDDRDHDRGRDTDAWLRALDAEDGGYDWGPEGPPE
ncbi:CopG family transcriptional regulator [Sphingomonas bacterium]|uniref:ribbon-helix-helix domain-containing protein n=1 Tax=Sphingomonas bacterium TaxID=1895847 RepID=UPI0015773E6B|nr:CopG family transcriptional regulator [Sphingomonas bacterium]